jgi:hypothetical protein
VTANALAVVDNESVSHPERLARRAIERVRGLGIVSDPSVGVSDRIEPETINIAGAR